MFLQKPSNIDFLAYFFKTFSIAVSLVAAPLTLLQAQSAAVRFELSAVFNDTPSEVSRLKNAGSLSVSLTGDMYVADTGNNRLVKFNAKGEYVNHVGGFGWKPNQFDMPLDVVCPDALSIYVADYNNQRVQRYDKNLQYVSSLGGSKLTELSSDQTRSGAVVGYPSGVAVSSQGDLFYTDAERGLMVKINRFGTAEATFGGFSEGAGKLVHPGRVVVTRRFVSVLDDRRVVQFDYFGNFIRSFGEDLLKKPVDLAMDDTGNCYVADTERNTVLVFDPAGQFVVSLTQYEFAGLRAVDVFRHRLYVLDGEEGKIVVFDIVESSR